jgi:predicted NUDIX family NTP pyrophosphohydrolase
MSKPISAGILLYRIRAGTPEVFLVHPGGPYWQHKEVGAWSIPKGEIEDEADPLAAAQREFHEETGSRVSGEFVALTPLKQRSGKLVHAWAVKETSTPRRSRAIPSRSSGPAFRAAA